MTIQKNDRDTIIDEIHRAHRAIADKFQDNITAILDDARRRQAASGRAVWQGKRPNQAPIGDRPSDANTGTR